MQTQAINKVWFPFRFVETFGFIGRDVLFWCLEDFIVLRHPAGTASDIQYWLNVGPFCKL